MVWEYQEVVQKAGWYHSRPFKTGRGLTQGDPLYPTLFNIVVNTMVRVILLEVCGLQEAHHTLEWASG